jgi:ketosteroid isomerase-like protein
MTDAQRQIADRLAIERLLISYGIALDTRDSKLLATCFTADAVLEYDAAPPATRAEFVERARGLTKFVATQHVVSNIAVRLDGDRARASSYAHAMHVRGESGGRETYLMGGTYTDILARTPDGWRIRHRRFVCGWAAKQLDVLPG